MHTATLKEAILPVVQEDNCIFIGLTTPDTAESEMHQLLSTKDDNGIPIITTIRIGKPCDECVIAKVLCIHSKDATPEGTSKKKRQRFKNLYKSDPHTFMREYQGQVSDANMLLFNKDWLITLAGMPPKPVIGPIDFLLMTLDPAQGGNCEWGVCISYFDLADSGCQVIVQLDAYKEDDLSPTNLKNILLYQLATVRSAHIEFRRIPIAIACEAAPKIISFQLQLYLTELIHEGRVSDVIMMNELDPKGRMGVGVPKNNQNTQMMIRYTQNLLETKRVAFSEVLRSSVQGKTPEMMKQEYLKQLSNFHLEEIVSPTTGKITLKITGKRHGCNDDLGVAAIMAPYWYERFYLNNTNKAYSAIKATSAHWRKGRYVKFFHAVLEKHHVDEPEDLDPLKNINSSKKPRIEVY